MQDGHTYIPPPGRTLYLEVGMCVWYVEMVVCVHMGILSGECMVYTHICVYSMLDTHTHIYTIL